MIFIFCEMRVLLVTILSMLLFSCMTTRKKDGDKVSPFKGKVLCIHPDSTPLIDTIDFGRISMGEMVEQTIRIKNSSIEKPLVLLSHDTNCGCTTLDYDKKPIVPSSYKDVTFTFNSKFADGGRQLKLVKIYSSFMKKPFKFYVMAQVD